METNIETKRNRILNCQDLTINVLFTNITNQKYTLACYHKSADNIKQLKKWKGKFTKIKLREN